VAWGIRGEREREKAGRQESGLLAQIRAACMLGREIDSQKNIIMQWHKTQAACSQDIRGEREGRKVYGQLASVAICAPHLRNDEGRERERERGKGASNE
jgi:hypothetical protein